MMKSAPSHIFKSYDIRGIYPSEINEENITAIVRAIYKFLHKDKKQGEPMTVVVGTDMRISSPALTAKAIETLVNMGAYVIDIGIVSTPTFYFAVSHFGYDAGIQITASHNPKEYNGIKIVKKGEKGLIKIGKPTGMDEIKEMAISEDGLPDSPGGKIEKREGILEQEVENSIKIAGNPKVDEFTIVADAANAMGAQYIDALFKKISGNLIRMNFELDGTFPVHQPDPLQADTLVDLQKKVVEEKANFGLAPDGDGDRLFFIDEKGQIVPPTIITSIVARELLKKNPGEKILVDIRYYFTPKKIVDENNGELTITKVGHAFISDSMSKNGAIFAGESSGHYFFRDTGNAESQMPIILFVLKVLSERKKPLSEVVEEYKRSFESGEFNFKVSNAKEIMDALQKDYSDGLLDSLDGIAINYDDWRFSVRTSNTEPLLRLNVESYTKEVMEEKKDELKNKIGELAN